VQVMQVLVSEHDAQVGSQSAQAFPFLNWLTAHWLKQVVLYCKKFVAQELQLLRVASLHVAQAGLHASHEPESELANLPSGHVAAQTPPLRKKPFSQVVHFCVPEQIEQLVSQDLQLAGASRY
jgi:hypothetical protein